MSFWKKSAGVFDFSLRISLTKVISIDDVINWVTELVSCATLWQSVCMHFT